MWQIGNTTVRSALRLREGLIALKKSGQEGKIRGKVGNMNMDKLLDKEGVIELSKDQIDDTYSVGRKWRSAMDKMGFLYPKLEGEEKSLQDQIGIPDYITPSGQRLIEAESLSGWHECHFRAMISYFIDYEDLIKLNKKKKRLEIINSKKPRYPFIFILRILTYLDEVCGDSKISKTEMGLIIQCTDPKTNSEDVVKKIINFRKELETSSSKKKFKNECLTRKSEEIGLRVQTIGADYPDTTFRYLKATGVICSRGKNNIAIVPEELLNIKDIIQNEIIPKDQIIKYKESCFGASLPTDDSIEKAVTNLINYGNLISEKGKPFDISQVDTKDIKATLIATKDIKESLFKLKEIDFAREQKNKSEEILKYIELLIFRKKNETLKGTLSDKSKIQIPKDEHPAYFEWAIWRAFLSLDSLSNKPWDARRFQIDQEFFPLNHAPGGGADVIIELENILLIVEVTLTNSSRQEAAEGEPVRKHVADAVEKNKKNKKVYGLFIAINIDTNTANTFRLGEWYTKDDLKLELDIVPLTLNEFKLIFDAVKDNPSRMLRYFHDFLEKCRADSKLEAPKWKKKISHNCNSLVEKLSSHDAILA